MRTALCIIVGWLVFMLVAFEYDKAKQRYQQCVRALETELNRGVSRTPVNNYLWARRQCASFWNLTQKGKWDKK
jgi:hypothetical protein